MWIPISQEQDWWSPSWYPLKGQRKCPYLRQPALLVYEIPPLALYSRILFNSHVGTALRKCKHSWQSWHRAEQVGVEQNGFIWDWSQTVEENWESGWRGACLWKLVEWEVDWHEGREGGGHRTSKRIGGKVPAKSSFIHLPCNTKLSFYPVAFQIL